MSFELRDALCITRLLSHGGEQHRVLDLDERRSRRARLPPRTVRARRDTRAEGADGVVGRLLDGLLDRLPPAPSRRRQAARRDGSATPGNSRTSIGSMPCARRALGSLRADGGFGHVSPRAAASAAKKRADVSNARCPGRRRAVPVSRARCRARRPPHGRLPASPARTRRPRSRRRATCCSTATQNVESKAPSRNGS